MLPDRASDSAKTAPEAATGLGTKNVLLAAARVYVYATGATPHSAQPTPVAHPIALARLQACARVLQVQQLLFAFIVL